MGGLVGVGRAARAAWALLVLSACQASGPSPGSTAPPGTITVASFDFPESEVLAEVYGQALRGAGLPVRVEANLGPRELVEPALLRGLVDLVPEYAGAALAFLAPERKGTADPAAAHAALERALASTSAAALAGAPAQDANAFAVTRTTAARYGLRTVSDLAPLAGKLILGGPPECPQRQLCLAGMQRVYHLHFRDFAPLDTGGALTKSALSSGDVDVALVFTSDPAVAERGFVLLEDDRHLEPAENVTPVVSRDLVRRYGDRLTRPVDAVSARLTTAQLVSLNRAVANGRSPAAAAAAWLQQQGLFP